MTSKRRDIEVRDALMDIAKRKGWIYTLGMCIGILAKASLVDYTIYKDVLDRHRTVTGKD
jgi:hypothetical protein